MTTGAEKNALRVGRPDDKSTPQNIVIGAPDEAADKVAAQQNAPRSSRRLTKSILYVAAGIAAVGTYMMWRTDNREKYQLQAEKQKYLENAPAAMYQHLTTFNFPRWTPAQNANSYAARISGTIEVPAANARTVFLATPLDPLPQGARTPFPTYYTFRQLDRLNILPNTAERMAACSYVTYNVAFNGEARQPGRDNPFGEISVIACRNGTSTILLPSNSRTDQVIADRSALSRYVALKACQQYTYTEAPRRAGWVPPSSFINGCNLGSN